MADRDARMAVARLVAEVDAVARADAERGIRARVERLGGAVGNNRVRPGQTVVGADRQSLTLDSVRSRAAVLRHVDGAVRAHLDVPGDRTARRRRTEDFTA